MLRNLHYHRKLKVKDRNKQRENKIHLGNQSEHNDSDNLEKRKVSSIIFISVIVILFVLLLYMR